MYLKSWPRDEMRHREKFKQVFALLRKYKPEVPTSLHTLRDIWDTALKIDK